MLVSADAIWSAETRTALEAGGVRVDSVSDADDAFALVYAVATRVAVLHVDGLPESLAELTELFGPVTRTSPVTLLLATEQTSEHDTCISPEPHAAAAAVFRITRRSRPPQGGRFDAGGFEEQLSDLSNDGASGVLVVHHADLVAKVVLSEGRIVLYTSSDPEDRVGQICLAHGLVTEADLREALARQRASLEPLGRILSAVATTEIDVDTALAEHYVQAVAELFLWEQGSWSFHPSDTRIESTGEEPHLALAIGRGLAGRAEWKELRTRAWLTPTTMVRRAEGPGIPDTLAGTGRRVAELVGEPHSIEAVRLELRSTRLETYRAIAVLVEGGILVVVGNTLRPPSDLRPTAPPLAMGSMTAQSGGRYAAHNLIGSELARAIGLIESGGERAEARAILRDVLALDPTNARALRLVRELDRLDVKSARSAGLTPSTVIELAVPLGEVSHRITPEAAYVLTRLTEKPYSVDDLLAMCPLSERDVLAILEDGLNAGHVTITGS